jgi:hypothetical protein
MQKWEPNVEIEPLGLAIWAEKSRSSTLRRLIDQSGTTRPSAFLTEPAIDLERMLKIAVFACRLSMVAQR